MARGIEPVIAAVILIAIAVVVAIAVIGWIMGLWGAVTTPREQLSVTGISYTDNEITLMVSNTGGATAKITKVSVVGAGCDGEIVNATDVVNPSTTIDPGTHKEVTITASKATCDAPVAGAMYQVTIYTEAGGIYSTFVKYTG